MSTSWIQLSKRDECNSFFKQLYKLNPFLEKEISDKLECGNVNNLLAQNLQYI